MAKAEIRLGECGLVSFPQPTLLYKAATNGNPINTDLPTTGNLTVGKQYILVYQTKVTTDPSTSNITGASDISFERSNYAAWSGEQVYSVFVFFTATSTKMQISIQCYELMLFEV